MLHLASDIGSISVDVPDEPIEDPTGQGRGREIKLEKHNQSGSKVWDGSVEWNKHENKRSFGRYEPRRQMKEREEASMNVKTSVGSIKVVF